MCVFPARRGLGPGGNRVGSLVAAIEWSGLVAWRKVTRAVSMVCCTYDHLHLSFLTRIFSTNNNSLSNIFFCHWNNFFENYNLSSIMYFLTARECFPPVIAKTGKPGKFIQMSYPKTGFPPAHPRFRWASVRMRSEFVFLPQLHSVLAGWRIYGTCLLQGLALHSQTF